MSDHKSPPSSSGTVDEPLERFYALASRVGLHESVPLSERSRTADIVSRQTRREADKSRTNSEKIYPKEEPRVKTTSERPPIPSGAEIQSLATPRTHEEMNARNYFTFDEIQKMKASRLREIAQQEEGHLSRLVSPITTLLEDMIIADPDIKGEKVKEIKSKLRDVLFSTPEDRFDQLEGDQRTRARNPNSSVCDFRDPALGNTSAFRRLEPTPSTSQMDTCMDPMMMGGMRGMFPRGMQSSVGMNQLEEIARQSRRLETGHLKKNVKIKDHREMSHRGSRWADPFCGIFTNLFG